MKNRGFTLIEMTIVVVIVALVVVGVLAGKDLVEQARITNTLIKIKSYQSATQTFQSIYNGLPGDLPGASNFGLDQPLDGISSSAGVEIVVMCDRTPDYCHGDEVDCDSYPSLCRGEINCERYPDICGSNVVDCNATRGYCSDGQVNCERYPDLCDGSEVDCRTYPTLCADEEEVVDPRNLARTNDDSTIGNGNGNKELNYYDYDDGGGGHAGYGGEIANFWVMLSNSKLLKETISVNYNCRPGAEINCDTTPGTNLPETPVGTGTIVLYNNDQSDFEHTINYDRGHYFILGIGDLDPSRFETDSPLSLDSSLAANTLKPEQAYGIDIKLDDGKPYKGDVQVIQGYDEASLISDHSQGIQLVTQECYSEFPFTSDRATYPTAVNENICTIAIKAGF